MKVSELKAIIRPMIKEEVKNSVKEIMLESGLLTSIISEVMKGFTDAKVLVERKTPQKFIIEDEDSDEELRNLGRNANINKPSLKSSEKDKLVETKKKLMENIGRGAYGGIDIFEGIKEVIPNETEQQPGNPMSSLNPNDPGVDVENLFDSKKMKAIMEGLNNSESRLTKKTVKI